MAIELKLVDSPAALKQFVYLPAQLHASHQGWVPPIYTDELKVFDKCRNLSHAYCESVYALALENGKPVGRIAGIINHRYNAFRNVEHGRFGYLESTPDPGVSQTLTRFVEDWAVSRKMDKLVGPMGFTEEDPEGFMIDGFDQVPNMATYQNYPYLNSHLEDLGYSKEVDYVVYHVPLATALTESYQKLFQRVSKSQEFRVLPLKSRQHLKRYMAPIFRLMNETFVNIYGYSPLEDQEMYQLAKRYLPLLHHDFIKLAVNKRDEVIGFILGIPSLAEGLIKARGKLYPLGILHILNARRRSTKLDTYIGAVKKEYRHKGVDTLLGYSMIKAALDAGFKILDGHHQLEHNSKIRAEMENVGGYVAKRYRIYQKALK